MSASASTATEGQSALSGDELEARVAAELVDPEEQIQDAVNALKAEAATAVENGQLDLAVAKLTEAITGDALSSVMWPWFVTPWENGYKIDSLHLSTNPYVLQTLKLEMANTQDVHLFQKCVKRGTFSKQWLAARYWLSNVIDTGTLLVLANIPKLFVFTADISGGMPFMHMRI
jgi:hypothetical protein